MRIHPLTEEGQKASKAKLEVLRAADEVRRETSHAKNDLESYILQVNSPYVFCPRAGEIVMYRRRNDNGKDPLSSCVLRVVSHCAVLLGTGEML